MNRDEQFKIVYTTEDYHVYNLKNKTLVQVKTNESKTFSLENFLDFFADKFRGRVWLRPPTFTLPTSNQVFLEHLGLVEEEQEEQDGFSLTSNMRGAPPSVTIMHMSDFLIWFEFKEDATYARLKL